MYYLHIKHHDECDTKMSTKAETKTDVAGTPRSPRAEEASALRSGAATGLRSAPACACGETQAHVERIHPDMSVPPTEDEAKGQYEAHTQKYRDEWEKAMHEEAKRKFNKAFEKLDDTELQIVAQNVANSWTSTNHSVLCCEERHAIRELMLVDAFGFFPQGAPPPFTPDMASGPPGFETYDVSDSSASDLHDDSLSRIEFDVPSLPFGIF
jgi:hypothetical protein